MKILLSPSKEVNLDNLEKKSNDINTAYFNEKVNLLNDANIIFDDLNVLSKKAIMLYSGLAFRQLKCLEDEFYRDVVILSSLYSYSYGTDYISNYRLDYTSKEGRLLKKEFYEEINQTLSNEDVIYNLASNEFSKGIVHPNMIDFEFLVEKDGKLKNISATSKKMRGAMVEYIRCNGNRHLQKFNIDNFKYNSDMSNDNKYVFVKE